MNNKVFIDLIDAARTAEEKEFMEKFLHQIEYGIIKGSVRIARVGTLSLTKRKNKWNGEYFFKGVFKLDEAFKAKLENVDMTLMGKLEDKFKE